MLILLLSLLAGLLVIGIRLRGGFENLFPCTLIGSTVYYGVFGYLYWKELEGGYFLDVNWNESIDLAPLLFIAAALITLASYYMALPGKQFRFYESSLVPVPGRLFYFSLFVGLFSCVFVFIDRDSRGGLFLVAYQFSDLLIPVILFGFVTSRRRVWYKLLVVGFLGYCLFVGFRYKIIITVFPLMVLLVLSMSGWRRWLLVLLGPLMILSLFTVVTITRVKFGGLDFDQLAGTDLTRVVYGLFAESNILFGVLSIVDSVMPSGKYVYFQPIVDSFLEMIPRFLLPGRETGGQIYLVLDGLYSDEGLTSGTTYPYFGEYMLMFGYTGFVVGCIILGIFVARLVTILARRSLFEVAWVGCSLVAVLFGYYYVSRGYSPQFFKAMVFILLPYIFFARKCRLKL